MLAQAVPAYYLLFTQHRSHLALRFNGLALFLEIIDPERRDLVLPNAVKKVAIGQVATAAVQQPQGSASNSEAPRSGEAVVQLSDEEVSKLKDQVEQLTVAEEQERSVDPNSVKNAVFVANAKKLLGFVKFFGEDLLQGIFQIMFVYEYWELLTIGTVVFTTSSVLAGLFVTLGGPLHALITERKSRQYYESLPKIEQGLKYEGVTMDSYEWQDVNYVKYKRRSMTFTRVWREPGEEKLRVQASLTTRQLHSEAFGAPAEDAEEVQQDCNAANRNPYVYETTLHGDYDLNYAMLELAEVQWRHVSGLGPEMQLHYRCRLKVLPGKIKGDMFLLDPTKSDTIYMASEGYQPRSMTADEKEDWARKIPAMRKEDVITLRLVEPDE